MANRVIDLLGQKFGRLTVVGRAPKVGKDKNIRWACICDCGNEHSVTGSCLRKGTIVSCGCYQKEQVSARFKTHGLKQTAEYRAWQSMKNRAKRRELAVSEEWSKSFETFLADVGEKPSPELELVLIDPEKGFVNGNTFWGIRRENQRQRSSTVFFEINGESRLIAEWCQIYDVPLGRVRGRIDRGWKLIDALMAPPQEQKAPEKHGLSDLPEYKIWRGIVERCKPDKQYGKRGITVSDEWKNSFAAFYEDVGDRPSPQHQLDRILGGLSSYEKGNTRWVTPKENCRNRTNNRLIEFNGETRCLSEWAERYGLDRCALDSRLKHGWSIERALTEPSSKNFRAANKENKKPVDSTHPAVTHGLSRTPEYRIWAGIIDRCQRDPNYIGKGIVICEEWRTSFQAFHKYILETIGLRPSPEHQIDRISGGNSPYAPGNLRWVTNKENARNTTKNRLLTYEGKTQAASAWAEEIGIKPATLLARIDRGWSIEKAITTPV